MTNWPTYYLFMWGTNRGCEGGINDYKARSKNLSTLLDFASTNTGYDSYQIVNQDMKIICEGERKDI